MESCSSFSRDIGGRGAEDLFAGAGDVIGLQLAGMRGGSSRISGMCSFSARRGLVEDAQMLERHFEVGEPPDGLFHLRKGQFREELRPERFPRGLVRKLDGEPARPFAPEEFVKAQALIVDLGFGVDPRRERKAFEQREGEGVDRGDVRPVQDRARGLRQFLQIG